jgi:hypothetical protein
MFYTYVNKETVILVYILTSKSWPRSAHPYFIRLTQNESLRDISTDHRTHAPGPGTMKIIGQRNSETLNWAFLMLKHRKKRLATFPSPAGISLTKLSLGGNNLAIPAQGEYGY